MLVRLFILAVFKNESHILYEWITHHLSIGVSHIYLVNDKSDDNPLTITDKFPDKVSVYTDGFINQKRAYRKYITQIPHEQNDWVAIIDLDEFIYSRGSLSVLEYIEQYTSQGVSSVNVRWLEFTNSNHVFDPPSKIEAYTLCCFEGPRNPCGKSICKVKDIIKVGIHESDINGKKVSVNPTYNALCINHYRFQSFEYQYGIKYERGGGIRKGKYKENTYEFRERPYYIDNVLKDKSKSVVNYAKKHHLPPRVDIYPSSPWNNVILKHMKQFRGKPSSRNITTVKNLCKDIESLIKKYYL